MKTNKRLEKLLISSICGLVVFLAALLIREVLHETVDYEMAMTMARYDKRILKADYRGTANFYTSSAAFKNGSAVWAAHIKSDDKLTEIVFQAFSPDQRSPYDWLTCQLMLRTIHGNVAVLPVRLNISLTGSYLLKIKSIRYIPGGECGC